VLSVDQRRASARPSPLLVDCFAPSSKLVI